MNFLAKALVSVVAGDLNDLNKILNADHCELLIAAENIPSLVVSRSVLTKLLTECRSGFWKMNEVHQWSSFVRRGYGPKRIHGAFNPIDIHYDARDEDLIVEIIGRLDEIGDQIDGDISSQELDEMIKSLQD